MIWTPCRRHHQRRQQQQQQQQQQPSNAVLPQLTLFVAFWSLSIILLLYCLCWRCLCRCRCAFRCCIAALSPFLLVPVPVLIVATVLAECSSKGAATHVLLHWEQEVHFGGSELLRKGRSPFQFSEFSEPVQRICSNNDLIRSTFSKLFLYWIDHMFMFIHTSHGKSVVLLFPKFLRATVETCKSRRLICAY